MHLFAIILYVTFMSYFLYRGFYAAFFPMLILTVFFLASLPVYNTYKIRIAKKKIYDTLKAVKNGASIKPFIEINSAPWFVIAELPGVNSGIAKKAVKKIRNEGAFKDMDEFIEFLNTKQIYSDGIRTVAYIKNKK